MERMTRESNAFPLEMVAFAPLSLKSVQGFPMIFISPVTFLNRRVISWAEENQTVSMAGGLVLMALAPKFLAA